MPRLHCWACEDGDDLEAVKFAQHDVANDVALVYVPNLVRGQSLVVTVAAQGFWTQVRRHFHQHCFAFCAHTGFDINNTKFSVMSGKRIFGPNFGPNFGFRV